MLGLCHNHPEMPSRACLVCGTATRNRCSACNEAAYCSERCQRDDSERHLALCNLVTGERLHHYNTVLIRGAPGVLVLAHTDQQVFSSATSCSYAHDAAPFDMLLKRVIPGLEDKLSILPRYVRPAPGIQ